MATSVVFPRVQFFANNGRPLIGGRIHTYVAGSSTRARTYKDAAKAQPNANPIILDARGEASVYLAEGVEYKFAIEDSTGALIMTQEPVYGAVWPNAAEWPSDATLSYQYMTEAKAAVDSMGITRAPFDTYAQAVGALPGLTNGERIEVSIDETRAGARTRYKVQAGALVFVVNLDQVRLDLAAASGAGMVGYLPKGVGAVATNVQAKLREFVSVKDFGAVGDGVTDDTAAFAAACASLGSRGGTVHYSARHRIANNLTIPDCVVLAGPLPASAGNTGYANILATAGASLLIDSAATISLRNNSGITGALIQRYGMAWYETSSAAFAGTAVTGIGNDCFLIGCFIAGFNRAFTSVGVERVRCTNVYGDCNNGISVDTSWDKTVISGCHFWPFVTQQSGLPAAAQLRSGTAFEFRGVSSYGAFNECFSYGYNRGFVIQDANDCVCTSCGADNNSAYAGSIGFLVTGSCAGNNLVGCSTSGCDTGYYFNSTNPIIGNDLHASKSWNNGVSGTGVIVNQGNVNISGGHIYNVTAGIIVGNAVSKVNIDSVQFSIVVSAIDATVPTSNVNISDSCIYNGVAGIRGANINPSVRASGVATITTGTHTVKVAHGLGAKPVFYTGAAANTNLGGRSLWFGADATNIYINVSSNVESDAVIMWEARTLP